VEYTTPSSPSFDGPLLTLRKNGILFVVYFEVSFEDTPLGHLALQDDQVIILPRYLDGRLRFDLYRIPTGYRLRAVDEKSIIFDTKAPPGVTRIYAR
jgi:hypothetical protein